MRNLLAMALVPTILSGSLTPVQAQEPSRRTDAAVALRFGTLGIGLEVNKWLTNHLGARISANWLQFSTSKTESDITYDATLKLHAVTALVDFFPGPRGTFHLTAGLVTEPAKVTGTGVPSSSGIFTINGTDYTSAEVGTLSATAKSPGVSPYLGIGWGTAARNGGPLAFLFDLGAAIGQPTITLTATGAASNPTLASDLQAEVRSTQDDVRKYAKVYPVLQLGLAYRF